LEKTESCHALAFQCLEECLLFKLMRLDTSEALSRKVLIAVIGISPPILTETVWGLLPS